MPTEIVVLATMAASVLATAIVTILVLQWRAGRTSGIFQHQLQGLEDRLKEAGEKQDTLAVLLSEGQVKNLELLHSRFAGAVDTLNRQLTTVTANLNEQLFQTRSNIGRQLEGTQRVVAQVQERLGELTSTARSMHDLGRDIARLQEVLQSPKLRGNLGELFLQEILSQVLPAGSYETQYSFSGGEKVDAAIRLGERIVPVDSKFPLESFNRILEAESDDARRRGKREFTASVRKRIDEIADRYIRPDQGTYDFALMYIPAENVFYEVIVKDEELGEQRGIFNYALEKHVVPVSPNSFYAYLIAIAYGLRGLHIEKRAKEIWSQLGGLQTGFERFADDFQVIGKHLDNARAKFGDADRRLEKIRESFRQIGGTEESTPIQD